MVASSSNDRIRAALAAAAIVLLSSGHAAAQRDSKRADALFREAKQLLDKGRVHDACERFSESYKLDPLLGALLNLADCHAREGRTATAQAEFAEAAKLAAQRGLVERERLDYALAEVAKLEKKLSHVRLVVKDDAIVDVAIDGQPVERSAWSAPIALDPGDHAVVARGKDGFSRTETIKVAVGPSAQTLELTLPAAAADRPAEAGDRGPARRIAGFAVGGVGLVAVGVGAYFGVRAIGKKGDGDAHCKGRFCDAKGLALHDDAHRSATISTVTMIAGLACAGAGLALVLTAGLPRKDAALSIRIHPVGLSGGALRVEGAF